MSRKAEEIYKIIGSQIAYYRRQQHKTQAELAEEVGMSASYLSKIERGNYHKSLSLTMLINIAEGLEVNVTDLLQK